MDFGKHFFKEMFQQISKQKESHEFWKALFQKEDFMNFLDIIFQGGILLGLLKNFFNDVKSHDFFLKHFHGISHENVLVFENKFKK